MNAPVLLIGYNRANLLKKSLDKLCELGVETVYVYLDGPKTGNPIDESRVKNCHSIVETFKSQIELKFKYNSVNQGCRNSVVSAINWAFQHEDMLLILEDDIEFGIDFLEFMNLNLQVYANNKKVLTIGGHNRVEKLDLTNINYNHGAYFTKYPDIWGWATWKDRWQEYDSEIFRKSKIQYFKLLKSVDFSLFMMIYILYNGYLEKVRLLDTWDFQLMYQSILKNKVNLISSENLVLNVGFGKEGTHTKSNLLKKQKMSKKVDMEITKLIGINKSVERMVQKSILHLFVRAGIHKYFRRRQ